MITACHSTAKPIREPKLTPSREQTVDTARNRRSRHLRTVTASIPIERSALPRVDQRDEQDCDENERLDEPEHPELSQLDRPRIKENYLNVEDEEEQRSQVKPHRKSVPGAAARRVTAFECLALDRTFWRPRPGQAVYRDHPANDQTGHDERNRYWKPCGDAGRHSVSAKPMLSIIFLPDKP